MKLKLSCSMSNRTLRWPQNNQVVRVVAGLYKDGLALNGKIQCRLLIFYFFSVRLLSFVFFIPATTTNDLRLRRIFYPRFYPSHLFSYLNSWERASIFHFECSVLHKGTTGTICYNVFGMTRSLTGDWTLDLLHSKTAWKLTETSLECYRHLNLSLSRISLTVTSHNNVVMVNLHAHR